MATFTKTGEQSFIEWLYYSDPSSTMSSGLNTLLKFSAGVLLAKPTLAAVRRGAASLSQALPSKETKPTAPLNSRITGA